MLTSILALLCFDYLSVQAYSLHPPYRALISPTRSNGCSPKSEAAPQAWTRRGLFAAAGTLLAPAASLAIGDVDRWQADPGSSRQCLKRDLLGKCALYDVAADSAQAQEERLVISARQRDEMAALKTEEAGNGYIQKLLQQSEANRATNEAEVAMKSFENSQAGREPPRLPTSNLIAAQPPIHFSF